MDKEPFEVLLTQEQSKYLNELLPRGYSLQYSSSLARKIQLEQSVSKPVSKNIEKEEIKKAQVLKQALNSEAFQRGTGPASEDMTVCHFILQQLKKNDNSGPFLQKVDPEAQQCLDYYKVIKNPMDLSKIESNLKQGLYQSRKQFCEDIALIWRNSFIYNNQGSVIYKMTEDMSQLFQSLAQKYLPTTPIAPFEDSVEMNKRIFSSIKGVNSTKAARSNRNDMPLSQEAKNWIYKNVGRLAPEDTNSLCSLVKDYCKINNESMELNMDTLPIRAAGEVFEFITSKLPLASAPNPYPSESQEDPKKKIKGINERMDTPLSILEKKQLGFCIRQLPPEDLCGIWNIIQEGDQDSEVIEFDIDALPARKARALETYVKDKVQLQAKKQRLQKQVQEQIQQQQKQLLLQQSQGIMPSNNQEDKLLAQPNNSAPAGQVCSNGESTNPSNSSSISNYQAPIGGTICEKTQQDLIPQNTVGASSDVSPQTITQENIVTQNNNSQGGSAV